MVVGFCTFHSCLCMSGTTVSNPHVDTFMGGRDIRSPIKTHSPQRSVIRIPQLTPALASYHGYVGIDHDTLIDETISVRPAGPSTLHYDRSVFRKRKARAKGINRHKIQEQRHTTSAFTYIVR